ncbi:MAG: penicillin acylase family protein [Gordonia sp. (in: high G+C Gram-positive bacteria)]|uniref:penicillin acylase family protein n=1 Tax=Gordonia sp. (in: high G+C Gram-positive bacteria) TaxID=84139 RepID=UPI0039E694C7
MTTPTDENVEILRDDHGIPHIWAGTPAGVCYGQGRACALDRAWQIEFLRLRAEGRTAEAFGSTAVDWDRFARRSGMDRAARSAYERSSARTRGLLDAYAAGVNSTLDEATAPELVELRHRPAPWQPWTPIAVFLMHHILFGRFTTKLWRLHALRAVGRDGLTLVDLEGDDPENRGGVPPLPDDAFLAELLADPGLGTAHHGTGTAPGDVAHGDAPSGSNAWAVAGGHSATGGALIAGDPHRFLELPGIYLQCQLACPEFDVVGFAFAGVPGVPHFAHAGEVAWAITNAMGDYQDLYRERLTRADGAVLALTPDGEVPAASWTERIAVAGAPDEAVEVVVTGNGPVILGGPDEPYALSLRTPLLSESEGFGFDAVLDLLFAHSIADVEQALSDWSEPVNRIVIADGTGRVHRHVAGAMPRRAPENYWLPVPGWDARYAWTGNHGASVADAAFDPAVDGHTVIANQRIADCPPLQPVTTETVAPARADRIDALLTADEAIDGQACAAIHRDVQLADAAGLCDLVARVNGLSDQARQLRDRITAWDGAMAVDSTGAYLFASLRSRLVAALAAHPVFAPLAAPHGFTAILDPWFVPHPRIAAALPTVLHRAGDLGIDLDALTASALEAVAAAVDPDDVPTWGSLHRFAPIHGFDLMGASPVHPDLSAAVRPERAPLGGDAECVFANAAAVGFDDQCRVGSAARYIWDLDDRDAGHWIVPMGAHGDPSSPHFQDQLGLWAAGDLLPIVSDWAALRAGAVTGALR